MLVAQHFASISAVAVTQSSCQGPQQVALFEHLESKVVKCVVPLVVDFRLNRVTLRPRHRQQLVRHERPVRAVMGRAGMELPNDHRKRRARVLVMVRHHDALGELRILRMRGVERRAQMGRSLVELHRRYSLSNERLGQVYGVNQAGGLSGFSKRVGLASPVYCGCVVLSDEHKWAAHSSSSTVISPYRTIRTSVWCESSGLFEWVE